MILAAYGVVPRTIRLLCTYWVCLNMVARSGGYFWLPCKGDYGVTQGDPLYPTIFNVVMDVIICHCVAVVAPTEDGMEGLVISIQELASYFYASNGLFALTHPERLQRTVYVLVGLFNRFGLRTNARKMVSMAFQPCHAPGQISSESYGWQMTGTGPSFQERQRRR